MFPTWLRRSLTQSETFISHGLLSPDAFSQLLERERLRSDRSRGKFSLLTLRLARRNQPEADIGRVAAVLKDRLRATDDASLLEWDCVGILLPDTGATGARTLADRLTEKLAEDGVPVNIHIEVYPILIDDDSPDDGSAAGLAATNGDSVPRRRSAPSKPLVSRFSRPMPPWKRLIDLTGAATGLVLLSPVLLASAAAVRLSSQGPVFYKQRRTGLSGKPFTMYKFRSMIVNADEVKDQLRDQNEQDGPAFKIEKDPRVTRVGRFLRITSLDELPQLWNVLCGDMSLVGPRPLPVEEAQACLGWQHQRLDVTPGLTCLWQVMERRNKIPFDDWVRLDVKYIRSRSLRQDLGLICRTIGVVIGSHRRK